MDKSVLKSKTFWLGIVTAVAPLFPGAKEFLVNNPEAAGSIIGGLIILVRKFTDKKIRLL